MREEMAARHLRRRSNSLDRVSGGDSARESARLRKPNLERSSSISGGKDGLQSVSLVFFKHFEL